MLKIGFIGSDNVTDIRCRMLLKEKEVRLGYCCNSDLQKADRLADRYGMQSLPSQEKVIESSDIVFIADLVDEQKSTALLQAIDKGKGVVCEPPMIVKDSDRDEVQKRIAKNGAKCTVSFYSRYQNSIRSFRDLVHSGRLGRPRNYWVQISDFIDPVTIEPGASSQSSPLLRILMEELDLFRWIGGEVVDWKAQYGEQDAPGGGHALALSVLFTLEGGKSASLMLCTSSKWRQTTRGFICAEGSVKMTGDDRWRSRELSFAVPGSPDTQTIRFSESYSLDLSVREHDHAFIHSHLTDKSPIVSLQDGLHTSEVACKLIRNQSTVGKGR